MDLDVGRLIRYPMESDDWLVTIAIGGFSLLLSFLIVPWFLVMGYLVETLRSGMAEAEAPPVFEDWGRMLKEGLVAAVIGFVYQLIPLVVFVVFVGGSALALLSGTDAGAGAGIAGLFGGLALSWVLSILFAYVGMAGVANYATEGRFGAGFDLGVIGEVVTDGAYMVAWGYVIALQIVVAIVVGLLNAIPIIGAIVGVFVSFYALVITGWLLGRGFAAALDRPASPEPEAAGAAQ